jgi:hypothetical protein
VHEHTHEKRLSSGASTKRNAPAREDVEARRDRLLGVLRVVVPALPGAIVIGGHECKIIDPKSVADEYGFHPLQIINDLRDLGDLGLIGFGHTTVPTGKPAQYGPAWVVRLL